MRFLARSMCALAAVAALLASGEAHAYEVFATSFFPPGDGDPDPELTGVLKIDTTTGAVSTFIPEAVGGLTQPTDIVYAEDTGTIYVSTQNGYIWHYDATTGAPRASLVEGEPAGVFTLLPTAGFSDGVNSLLLSQSGSLVAATAFGAIVPYDRGTGAEQEAVASGLPFPSGLAESLDGTAIYAAVGDPFGGPGGVQAFYSAGSEETIVSFTSTSGISGAANPVVIAAPGDYTFDGDTNGDDYEAWSDAYGDAGPTADGNGDGVVDAADYTIWRDTQGESSALLFTDLHGNRIASYDGPGSDSVSTLTVVPPEIPDPLPPTANPLAPSNSPSELLLTPQSTLLLSTLGLTQRPDNRGALLELDRDGTLIRTIADGLPPISGIAFAPSPSVGAAIPEPAAAALLAACLIPVLSRGRV